MGVESDRQWRNPDGTISARYRVEVLDEAWVKSLYDRKPRGNKSSLPAFVAKWADRYQVLVDGRGIGVVSVNWTRLDGRLNQAPLPATVNVERVVTDEGDQFQVTAFLLNV